MQQVNTPNAPPPGGHYSQATIHNNTIYVSGQLPIDPATGSKEVPSIEVQTRQVLENVRQIVEAGGGSLASILKVTVYVSDMTLWDDVNKVYAEYFGPHRPARCIVPTKDLHYGFNIEVDAVAAVEG